MTIWINRGLENMDPIIYKQRTGEKQIQSAINELQKFFDMYLQAVVEDSKGWRIEWINRVEENCLVILKQCIRLKLLINLED